jgi:hypothetical protein
LSNTLTIHGTSICVLKRDTNKVSGSITAREAKIASIDTRQASGSIIARDPETCKQTSKIYSAMLAQF